MAAIMRRHAFVAVSFSFIAAWALPAAAHIELTNPPARYSPDFIKDPPCGVPGNPEGPNPPTVLQAGETITIEIDEFINHPGHFRISFSEDGTDMFVNPTAFDDFYPDPSVLMDDIPDVQNGGIHEIDFEVPNVNCDPCTIQVLQVMTEGSFSENSLYYQCADIVIEGAAGTSSDSGDPTTVTATDPTATATVTDTATDTADSGTTAGGGDDDTTGGGPETSGDPTAATANVEDTGPSEDTSGTAATTSENDEDGSGCSCRASGSPNAVWALPLFVVAVARRRR
jgi:MYXO-CTERM domain-containing protein